MFVVALSTSSSPHSLSVTLFDSDKDCAKRDISDVKATVLPQSPP